MNPCPCGYYGDPEHDCTCSTNQIIAYQKRLSGPLLDRIDMIVPVSRIPNDQLLSVKSMSLSQHEKAKNAIAYAKKVQSNRYGRSDKRNSSLTSAEIRSHIPLSSKSKLFLDNAATKLKLSTRGYFKILRVARTIADLDHSQTVEIPHLAEALQYRQNTWSQTHHLLEYHLSYR